LERFHINIRKSGIDIIGDIPWGTHFCQFYQTKDDLINILVPYFKAGLENNEFCMWITSEPLESDEALKALYQAIPNFDGYLSKGQIEILPYDEWYVVDGVFDTNKILDGWVDKLVKAQNKGFDGLRLTGNTFWLEDKDWDDFVYYEEAVDEVIENYQMIAMCTYCLDKCNANEIIDVVKNHEFALIKRDDEWTLLENKQKETEEALKKSQESYKTLYSTMSEGVAIHEIVYNDKKPVDYIITDINPAYEEITGLKISNVIGKRASDLYEIGKAPYLDIYSKVAETGDSYRFETYFEPMDKHFRIIVTSPGYGKFATFFEDITERKKAEEYKQQLLENEQNLTEELQTANEEMRSLNEELQTANEELQSTTKELQLKGYELSKINLELLNSETQFQALIQNMTSAVALIDDSGKFAVVNHSFMNMFGLDDEMDILNVNSQDWDMWKVYGEDNKLLDVDEHPVRKVAITGEPVKNQLVSVKNPGDDKLTTMLISAEPLKNRDGSIQMTICTYYDITERKKSEESLKFANSELMRTQNILQETINKLEVSNTELEQFAYIASHDLQEPLRMVASFTQLLEMKYRDELDEEALEYISFAVDGAKRMKALINDLLAYSRVTSKKREISQVNLDKVIDEALFNLELDIEENQAIISREPFPTIKCDSSQMIQVFQNLIGNALKYRSEITPEIHLSAQEKADEWIFNIKDNGIGIESEYNSQVFQIFRRLHTQEEYQGTGIGLAITKRIIENHSGNIWVESDGKIGSVFSFRLPKN
jgi:PAS domain S-box-containing protein